MFFSHLLCILIALVSLRDEFRNNTRLFHQVDGVRLRDAEDVFCNVEDSEGLRIFDHRGEEDSEKQGCHTMDAVKIMEHELKGALVGLAKTLFGESEWFRT